MPSKEYTDEDILSDLNEVNSIVDGRPKRDDFREHGSTCSPNTVVRRFGGWGDALDEAGIDYESIYSRSDTVTRSDIIDDLQRVAADIEESPTRKQYCEYGNHSTATVVDRFECWNDAKEAASLPIYNARKSRTELIDDLKRVKSDLDKTPTQTEYQEHGENSAAAIRTEFGCWTNGLRAADIELNQRGWIPEAEMLIDLIDVTDGNIAPPPNEYRKEGRFGGHLEKKTAESRYWEACVRAGLRPRTRCPLTPSSLDSYFRAIEELNQYDSIGPRLMLFTGLDSYIIKNISPDWMLDRDDPIIRVPQEQTDTGDPWVFRIPEVWVNPHTGETIDTNLPESLDWIFARYGEIPFEKGAQITHKVRYVASEADIDVERRRKEYPRYTDWEKYESELPVVRPPDLRTTYGINLARQNVDIDTIQHRIGLNRMNRLEQVSDYFVWLYQFEDHCHPDYEPSGTYINPDTRDIETIESEGS